MKSQQAFSRAASIVNGDLEADKFATVVIKIKIFPNVSNSDLHLFILLDNHEILKLELCRNF